MDETYIKVKGKWCYLYRAVDSTGQTVDFLFRAQRDGVAAKAFFKKAISNNGKPEKITIDKSGSNIHAIKDLNENYPQVEKIEMRQIKYLNNIVEQDHRFIKKRVCPMLGFKSFYSAKRILAGIESVHMIYKKQLHNCSHQSTFTDFSTLMAA